MMLWRRKIRRDLEIAPDEIFLDASNTPAFDRARFEGRIEKPLSHEMFYWLAAVLAFLISILVIRSWNLQMTHGADYVAESANNSLAVTTLFAPRGFITDTNGIVLTENVERPDGSIGRQYIFPSVSHIIGYVSYPKKDSKGIYYDTRVTGITGIEAQYDSVLAGKNGQLLTETDVLGNVRSEGIIVPPEEGKPLKLTIDVTMQESLENAIREITRMHRFIAGSGVVMDVQTGEVRALVSYPSYDSNVMSNGGPSSVINAYNNDPGHPFIDHALQGVYTPGSVVKPIIAAGALTDGIITPNTVMNDPGFISIPDPYHPGKKFIYKSWKALGPMNVRSAIAWSSDVFFYTIGGGFGGQKGLGIDRLVHWYRQFGLGSPTGISLGGEASGLIPTPEWKLETFNEPWYLGDTYFTAIGQYSVQVTPMQMARATAAIANGGTLLTPKLRTEEVVAYTSVPVDTSALAVVREGMRQTVTTALAQALNVPYINVAAKTGTAQTGTRNQFDNSWVIGFFPYDAPRYAFVVVLERGPEGSGSQAVNAMRKFFDALFLDNSPYLVGESKSNE